MTRNISSHMGSGSLPYSLTNPKLAAGLTADKSLQYPFDCATSGVTHRTGTAVGIINPEDFSVSKDFQQSAVSVTNAAAPVPSTPLPCRRALTIHNNGLETIYIGGPDVTILNGFPITAGEKIAFDIQGNNNVFVYAIAAAGPVDVRVLELA